MRTAKGWRGFTLIELIVVIALLAIVAAMAMPNFIQFIRNNQVQSKTDELVSFLQYARSQALVSRTPYEINIADNTQWQAAPAGAADAERLLSFNLAQAQPRITTLADSKLIYRANGMVLEPVKITLCHADDYSHGYFIEVKAGGSIHVYRRGNKSDSDRMTSCTPA